MEVVSIMKVLSHYQEEISSTILLDVTVEVSIVIMSMLIQDSILVEGLLSITTNLVILMLSLMITSI